MATTVNNAFCEFMRNVVNLDPVITKKARMSRDNLLANIAEFDNNDDFFNLHDPFNVHFGSFARNTKCRELDDVDLMIGVDANGCTYYDYSWDDIVIWPSATNAAQIACVDNSGYLNSTKMVNKFKKKLESVREYSRSEIKRNGEAIVLNLISKDWSFDVVPCFHTTQEADGRSYYLIPNGNGRWKKTDPTIDRAHVQQINQDKKGLVLEFVRLVKRWNKTKKAYTMPSYLLEVLILDHCMMENELSEWIDIRFKNALLYIANHITKPIYDPKKIQGNINAIPNTDQLILKQKALDDYQKACNALEFEIIEKDDKKSINKWGEIFGGDFPAYG